MSAFNKTEVIVDASVYTCPAESYDVDGGLLRFAFACIPFTATSATEVTCPPFKEMMITTESTCETVLATTVHDVPESECYLSCEFTPTATTNLAARGLLSEDYVTGAASTLHPSSFAITFAAIFFVALMFFKRSH
ncbi:hypothetical protein BDF21DRAFT_419554 [Thamnidium elegans]|uniref:Transmembrane protein n=1 Tax=Thamnidium elegans TaxID=101142 RepID=A0A8H7SHA5_9FUNG|nr:hypothetical protein INT48_008763 [Thamnidium elegans]KAI8079155.1 hypothetical protein BDF21DRAFT_419554 [Thamnidium elegans]